MFISLYTELSLYTTKVIDYSLNPIITSSVISLEYKYICFSRMFSSKSSQSIILQIENLNIMLYYNTISTLFHLVNSPALALLNNKHISPTLYYYNMTGYDLIMINNKTQQRLPQNSLLNGTNSYVIYRPLLIKLCLENNQNDWSEEINPFSRNKIEFKINQHNFLMNHYMKSNSLILELYSMNYIINKLPFTINIKIGGRILELESNKSCGVNENELSLSFYYNSQEWKHENKIDISKIKNHKIISIFSDKRRGYIQIQFCFKKLQDDSLNKIVKDFTISPPFELTTEYFETPVEICPILEFDVIFIINLAIQL